MQVPRGRKASIPAYRESLITLFNWQINILAYECGEHKSAFEIRPKNWQNQVLVSTEMRGRPWPTSLFSHSPGICATENYGYWRKDGDKTVSLSPWSKESGAEGRQVSTRLPCWVCRMDAGYFPPSRYFQETMNLCFGGYHLIQNIKNCFENGYIRISLPYTWTCSHLNLQKFLQIISANLVFHLDFYLSLVTLDKD